MPTLPPPPFLLKDTGYWRVRAYEVRSRALSFADAKERRMMLDIAANYDFLAEGADRLNCREVLRLLQRSSDR